MHWLKINLWKPLSILCTTGAGRYWLTDRHDWLAAWLAGWLAYGLTDWRTDGLTDWRTDGLTDWRTDGLTDWRTDWLADWLTGWLTDWRTDGLTDWRTGGLADWLTGWLADWLTGWLADWLTGWLADWLAGWLTARLADWLTGWLADWRTDGLTDWWTDGLTDWTDGLTDWRTDWLTDGRTDWLAGWLTDWLTDRLTGWLAGCLTVWLTDWLISCPMSNPFTDRLIVFMLNRLIDWFIDFIRITEPDRCHSLPCQNGGTCIQEITGTYKCQCQEGFRGFNCEGQHLTTNLLVRSRLTNIRQLLFFFFGFLLSLKSDVTYGFFSYMVEHSFMVTAGQFILNGNINLLSLLLMYDDRKIQLLVQSLGPTICLPILILGTLSDDDGNAKDDA